MRELAGSSHAAGLDDLQSAGEPVVLRGLVADWPSAAAARTPAGLVSYLARLDSGAPVDAIMTPPEIEGRIFYNADLSGFNFVRNRLTLTEVARQILRYAQFTRAPAVAVQSAPIKDCLPGFTGENPLSLLDPGVQPRIWLGSAITTPTHLDEWHNIGCVVCGRRRFTLFPPQELGNLYIGPLDFAPTGAPMSLVQLHAPDFARYPRFRSALAAARTAELGAGDAIYIPPLWWHHVESLDSFNVLVNYWWHALPGAALGTASGFGCLIHALLHLAPLPEPTRAAWRALFEHYVFGATAERSAHIPPAHRGILGEISPEDAARLRGVLAKRLQS